ncbi:MAG: GNAT family N-acetyltransferase [Promicromonosporaceae bacterium]|nr:GNAT family N-acetyltransferase [Promicromonosporaceae bacterium]
MEQFRVTDISREQAHEIDDRLASYDNDLIGDSPQGEIRLGIFAGDHLIAGAEASLTEYAICYLSTLFVDPGYRRLGLGSQLMREVERRAISLGAKFIRLDTFDFQNPEFYRAIGYEEIGSFQGDQFSEHFFLKRIQPNR